MKTLQTAPGTIAPDKPSNICLTNFRPVFKGSVSAVGMFARLEACTGMRPLALSGGDFILAAGNGIAVLLKQVPNKLTLNFPGCRFTGNGADIDNRCGQELNLSEAIFESP